MSGKRTIYTLLFKIEATLEVLKYNKTLNKISLEHNIIPKNIIYWGEKFLNNVKIAMESNKATKECKDKKIDNHAKTVGKFTIERDLAKDIKQKILTISQKELVCACEKEKIYRQLLVEKYEVSLNTVSKYRQKVDIKTISTTIRDNTYSKHLYKLKDININTPNRKWSISITYIKINSRMVYLATIIDWYPKEVFSWKISNAIDTDFTMNVLNNTLSNHFEPKILYIEFYNHYRLYQILNCSKPVSIHNIKRYKRKIGNKISSDISKQALLKVA